MNNDIAFIDTDRLLVQVNQAVAEMQQKGIRVTMSMDVIDLLAAIGAIQLACRHPALPGTTMTMLARLIGQVKDELREYPALVELIYRGGNADYDVTDQEARAFHLVQPGQLVQEQDVDYNNRFAECRPVDDDEKCTACDGVGWIDGVPCRECNAPYDDGEPWCEQHECYMTLVDYEDGSRYECRECQRESGEELGWI